jgi:hypothetical protein
MKKALAVLPEKNEQNAKKRYKNAGQHSIYDIRLKHGKGN